MSAAPTEPQTQAGAAPERDVNAVLRNLNFEFLQEWAATASSLWRSAEEAAFRGDEITFAVHLRQVRLVTFTVTKTLEEFAGVDKGVASRDP